MTLNYYANTRALATLIFLFLFTSNSVNAQYDNIWAFGYRMGLDFNRGSPPVPMSSLIDGDEASASVCNSSGELLFSTNGSSIWNKNSSIMPNGDSLTGLRELQCNYNYTECWWADPVESTAQGALIVPFPGDTNKYYVFSLTSLMGLDTVFNFPGHLFYSIVDMTLNGGMGDVVAGKKGILIDSGFTEQMTSVVGDDCNIWVVLHSKNEAGDSATFKSFEVNANGLNTTPVVSKAGIVPGNFLRGATICFSPDRSKLALTRDAIFTGSIELYDFDPLTGQVSNQRILNPNLNIGDWAACFSPDNSKLYVSGFSITAKGIRQYDLSSNNLTAIINSEQIISSLPKHGNVISSTDLKLASDGKIYYFGEPGVTERISLAPPTYVHRGTMLGSIDFPNLLGSAAGANDSVVSWGGPDTNTNSQPFLPQKSFPFKFSNVISTIKQDSVRTFSDTILCANSNNTTLQSPLEAATYIWQDGSTEKDFAITENGTYWVQSENFCHFRTDTFKVKLINLSPVINVDEFELSTTETYHSYQWYLNGNIIQGATNQSYTVTENGDYTVVVTGENGCTATSPVYKVTNVTAIPDIELLARQIKIYPNPAHDLIYINSPIKVDTKITSIEGKLIKERLNADWISLSELAEGIYLIRVTDQNGAVLKVEKLIKVK